MSDDLAKDTAALLKQILEHTERVRVEQTNCMTSLSPCFDLIDQLVSKLCEASNRRYVLVMADQDDGSDTQMMCVSSDEGGDPRKKASVVDLLQGALQCMQIEEESASEPEPNDLN